MSRSPSSSSLILPFHKGPQSRTSKHDLEPIVWKPRAEESDIEPSSERRSTVPDDDSSSAQCSVCRQNQGRYTCPKCEAPYCCVACYRKHNEHDDPSQGCSESFYHDRVAQVLRLEVKENEDETKRMLSRNYVQQQQLQLQGESEVTHDVTEEELYNILAVLEGGDEQELSRLLSSPRLKAAFERSVESGSLHDWFLEPWHPWWRQELVGYDQEQDSNDDEEGLEGNGINGKTLDERLLEVPPFRSLQPTQKAFPDLRFNLMSILYGISWTLRLYHGVENAKQVGIDAASTLVHSSCVLSADARFSTLEEVLDASAVASTQCYQGGSGCNTSWNVLAQDVALMYRNRRFVGRALLEAIGILRVALSTLKKEGDAEGASKKMRRIRKKVEFYLSWSLEQSTLCSGLSAGIEAWVTDWRPSGDAGGIELLLPEERVHRVADASRQQAARNIEQPALLKEVSVIRKN